MLYLTLSVCKPVLFQVKSLLADQAKARYLVKLHMILGEVNADTLKNGILYYTLTGKSAESVIEVRESKKHLVCCSLDHAFYVFFSSSVCTSQGR